MTPFYDARGNVYAVASPQTLRALGLDLPATAADAAINCRSWAVQAIDALCSWVPGGRPDGAKAHRCDGLLVGPFAHAAPFDLLIVNTDGTLAERSGNGLTIFAQALQDQSAGMGTKPFPLHVHHDRNDSPSTVTIEPAEREGIRGFWLDLGRPVFGPEAVDANRAHLKPASPAQSPGFCVPRLNDIDGAWASSVFVNIGNPHCVTLLPDAVALPSLVQLQTAPLQQALMSIAFAQGGGDPCPAGINLQWTWLAAPATLQARVFERGEGATASSGTSASAVACAAWLAGWVKAGCLQVEMPGGTAPIRLVEENGTLHRVYLFGTARLLT